MKPNQVFFKKKLIGFTYIGTSNHEIFHENLSYNLNQRDQITASRQRRPLRLMRGFRSSQISAPRGTGTLQIALNSCKHCDFLVY